MWQIRTKKAVQYLTMISIKGLRDKIQDIKHSQSSTVEDPKKRTKGAAMVSVTGMRDKYMAKSTLNTHIMKAEAQVGA